MIAAGRNTPNTTNTRHTRNTRNNQTTPPATLFQAVSDETRLRLLRLVHREELNVQELVRILDMNQPRISKHLAILRDTGWIRQRKQGTWSWYGRIPAAELPIDAGLHAQVLAAAEAVSSAARDDGALKEVLADRRATARDFFADLAHDWDRIRHEYEHQDIQLGAIGALIDSHLRIIDIGTGTGALLPLLAQGAGSVVAVDRSPAMLVRARELCERDQLDNVRLQRADIEALPFADASFDAACCAMVLHHVERPDLAISEMARVVRPGGKVVIIGFTAHDVTRLRDELAHRWLGFQREEIEGWQRDAGLLPLRHTVRRRSLRRGGDGGAVPNGTTPWPDVFLSVAEKKTAADV